MNLNIYNVIGLEEDPLYMQLQLVNSENTIHVDSFKISKDKFYEVSNEEVHLGFRDLKSCYQFLSNAIVLGGSTIE